MYGLLELIYIEIYNTFGSGCFKDCLIPLNIFSPPQLVETMQNIHTHKRINKMTIQIFYLRYLTGILHLHGFSVIVKIHLIHKKTMQHRPSKLSQILLQCGRTQKLSYDIAKVLLLQGSKIHMFVNYAKSDRTLLFQLSA